MALRSRISVLAAAIVGVVLVLASVACYLALRSELRSQIDDQLRSQAELIQRVGAPTDVLVRRPLPAPPVRAGGSADFVQILRRDDGEVMAAPVGASRAAIPVTSTDAPIVAGGGGLAFSDREIAGVPARVVTFTLGAGVAVQLGRPLNGVASTLSWLRWTLVVLCLVGTALAAAAGRALSRRAIAPLTRVTEAAEHIESTGDLARRVPAGAADDEPGRLATRFNAMLDRLQSAQVAQRQLVADASHELRTPVTALRTNVELLAHDARLSDADRAVVAEDALGQAEELSLLVGDLIELARGDAQPLALEDVTLAELAAEAVERGARHAPHHDIRLTVAEPVVVTVDRARVARALNNLIDNAVKYAPEHTRIDVTVGAGGVAVRDRGPGIRPDHLPYVFDRFYRGDGTREGSGLGLAIVKQIADLHHATAIATPAPDTGTIVALRFGG